MSVIQEKAYAKINLGLNVLGQREDGFHEVAMIMQTVGLADIVTLTEGSGITITTNIPELSCGADNLAFKAAMLLAERFKVKPDVHIHLEKHIFIAAGLAGGSADAAAVLRGLNKYWGLGLSSEELRAIATELGSDVPFCIDGGTAMARGRGERITPLPDMPETVVVLAKPKGLEISTAWVYQNYDERRVVQVPKLYRMKERLAEGGRAIVPYAGNVLETVTIPAHPVIAAIKAEMLHAGAYYAMMSGSGPSVFALADSEEKAQQVLKALKEFDVETVVTATVRRSQ